VAGLADLLLAEYVQQLLLSAGQRKLSRGSQQQGWHLQLLLLLGHCGLIHLDQCLTVAAAAAAVAAAGVASWLACRHQRQIQNTQPDW
jgi:hypothetical protein